MLNTNYNQRLQWKWDKRPCGTETNPIIKCYWGWKTQLNPFLKRWIRSPPPHPTPHTHICLSPPPCILNTTLKQSSINLVQFYTPVHLKTQHRLCVAEPSLTWGQWQQYPPDFHLYHRHRGRDGPAFTPLWTLFLIRELKEWRSSHRTPKTLSTSPL